MILVSSWRSINPFERDVIKEKWVKLHKSGCFILDLMCNQVMVHTGMQTNDLEMLICGWKMFLPLYFARKMRTMQDSLKIIPFFF